MESNKIDPHHRFESGYYVVNNATFQRKALQDVSGARRTTRNLQWLKLTCQVESTNVGAKHKTFILILTEPRQLDSLCKGGLESSYISAAEAIFPC